jgi:hypothetical protein
METYRLSASALLRLASIASEAPDVDAGEVLSILQGAVLDAPAPVLPHVDEAPPIDGEGADKPAKPE